MEIFSARTQAAIQIAVDDFGDADDKEIWHRWATTNPQVRHSSDDPTDDGKGPILPELRNTIMFCLRRRYDHLHEQCHSPLTTPEDFVELSNKMSHLYAIIRRLSPSKKSALPSF